MPKFVCLLKEYCLLMLCTGCLKSNIAVTCLMCEYKNFSALTLDTLDRIQNNAPPFFLAGHFKSKPHFTVI
jgi:hypothetical protein